MDNRAAMFFFMLSAWLLIPPVTWVLQLYSKDRKNSILGIGVFMSLIAFWYDVAYVMNVNLLQNMTTGQFWEATFSYGWSWAWVFIFGGSITALFLVDETSEKTVLEITFYLFRAIVFGVFWATFYSFFAYFVSSAVMSF